jgi:hypothetical protein
MVKQYGALGGGVINGGIGFAVWAGIKLVCWICFIAQPVLNLLRPN